MNKFLELSSFQKLYHDCDRILDNSRTRTTYENLINLFRFHISQFCLLLFIFPSSECKKEVTEILEENIKRSQFEILSASLSK